DWMTSPRADNTRTPAARRRFSRPSRSLTRRDMGRRTGVLNAEAKQRAREILEFIKRDRVVRARKGPAQRSQLAAFRHAGEVGHRRVHPNSVAPVSLNPSRSP